MDILSYKYTGAEIEVKIDNAIRETIRIGTDQIAEIEDNTDKTEVGLEMNNFKGEVT